MARNAEKAQSMLNRYLRQKKEDAGLTTTGRKRPYLATLCEDVKEAERWRRQVLGEIGRKVVEIQDKNLEVPRIRELNDEINKLLREKGHWERRIVQLGGKDHSKTKLEVTDDDSGDVVQSRGYYYFGAARNLPGVKDIVDMQQKRKQEREREKNQVPSSVLYRRLNAFYYGDEEGADDEFKDVVKKEEERIMTERIAEWERQHGKREGDWDWDDSFEQVTEGDNISVEKRLEDIFLELKKKETLDQLIGSSDVP